MSRVDQRIALHAIPPFDQLPSGTVYIELTNIDFFLAQKWKTT